MAEIATIVIREKKSGKLLGRRRIPFFYTGKKFSKRKFSRRKR